MFKTRTVAISTVGLLLIGSWVVLPLIMATETEPQREKPEGEMRQPIRQDGMRPGQMDPEGMETMMLGRMKNELAATDQEWTAIEPQLRKVMTLSNEINPRDMGTGMMGGHFGRPADQTERGAGQPARPAAQIPQSEFQKTSIALRQVTQKTDATPEEIGDKLAAFRTARAAAQKELADERNKLQKVLNPRQEAKLVLMGTLD